MCCGHKASLLLMGLENAPRSASPTDKNLLLNMVRVSRDGVKRVKNNPKMAVGVLERGSVIKMCGVYQGPSE
ncbi:hypothetical protein COLSTE_02240 [Collinsella stercoris DSM 13279]|uniref:Uncharacterized protein n=1 Tax=Collinsella stercoris DSM 13279 TaxID=445975 RepID=B6GDQ8_9ACTN|nr:hypothetical protein COLSTE_02240 [Collinsella stercoris DSM 13279]